MSTPPRRSRRSRRLASAATAAPSPDTPPPARLLDLPTDLLVRVVSRCDPVHIARVAAVSLLFHASLAVDGIRLWAQERGFELPAQPEGEGCTVRWLCFAALLRESNPPARVAAGKRHSLFIDGEGRLSTCGTARYLGVEVLGMTLGAEHIPGLLGHGEGVTQLNTPTRLPSALGGERAVSVSAGHAHSLALAANGAVWSWGTDAQLLPTKVEAFTVQRVVAVSAVYAPGELCMHSFAITADGAAWSWGIGCDGVLGHGDQQDQLLPKKIEAFADQRVMAVSAGGGHSLAITADGSAWSWGIGWPAGGLGHGDRQGQLLPKKIEALAGQRVVAVSAGDYHGLALTADGAVWSWGNGNHGKLGLGDTERQLLPKKVEALAGRRVVAVATAGDHSLALTADGAVWSWGYGGQGRLGHGDQQNQLLPKKIEAFAGQRVVAVAAGDAHSLAITADGAVWSWGEGECGCLGHGGDLSDQPLPKKVETWA